MLQVLKRFFRWVYLEGYRLLVCRGFRHYWGGRELDLMQQLPGYRNPFLMVCSKCGYAAMREEDDF